MIESKDKRSKVAGSGVASSTSVKAKAVDRLEPTPEVIGALKGLGPAKPVSAGALANAILDQADHRETYAGGVFLSAILEDTAATKPAEVWLRCLPG